MTNQTEPDTCKHHYYHSTRTVVKFEKIKDEYYIWLGLQGWEHGGDIKIKAVTDKLLIAVIEESKLQEYLQSFSKCAYNIEVTK